MTTAVLYSTVIRFSTLLRTSSYVLHFLTCHNNMFLPCILFISFLLRICHQLLLLFEVNWMYSFASMSSSLKVCCIFCTFILFFFFLTLHLFLSCCSLVKDLFYFSLQQCYSDMSANCFQFLLIKRCASGSGQDGVGRTTSCVLVKEFLIFRA